MPKYISKIIKGNDEILIKDATARSNKADKVSGATNNNLAALNSNGNLKDAGISVAELQAADRDALNTAAMFMLANFSGLPIKINNVEYKYVLTDIEDRVLFGKKQDDSWYFGDDTDDLMDAIIDQYAQDDTIFSNMYRLAVALSLARLSGTLSEIENPEWKWVILDSEDKVLMGIKQDNTWYLGATINQILDATLTTYSVAGATQGTFANKPTSPNVGQMYFCTDKQTTEGQTNGISIYWNGTNWTDALGRTVQ